MKLGMIGLGRMGWGMTQRLRGRGHEVVGFDFSPERRDVASLVDLVAALPAPRAVWVMVPAGTPTEATVVQLGELLEPGDLVIDGGNSNFHDSVRRGELLARQGVYFIDAGVSGGIWGLQEGFCLMVGGAPEKVATMQPIFDALAPEGGFVHCGPVGAGHFTKMVHNGIEYGMMQAYAEGFELLGASELKINTTAVVDAWGHGSVIRSWLLELLASGLADDPRLERIRPYVEDSGEGRWTVEEAVRLGVPANVLSASLFARFTSRQDDSPAMKVLALLRHGFGGHAVRSAGASPD
ncbi:MAG: 6-phosphogluconate dehydrogenase [Actinomycetota bacterium]|jgi:6-phosphogluconate dehydrogenase|nr:6-phosphogluconate dehydrogenase [Actinomycetota bacterium]